MTGMTWDSGNGPQPYASATYGPAGQMLTLSYGAGTETRTYNSLLQLTNQSVPGYLNMTYNYSAGQNNGRIVGSVDGITGENTTYTYDALNRLASATASGMWSESYSYDGFGNLTGKRGTGGAPSMTASYNAQNQQVGGGATYDANGNQTTANNTLNVFTVENRIKSQASTVWPYPQIAEYAYDPHGRRVMQQTDPDPDIPNSASSYQYNFYGITGQRLVTLGCTNPSANPLPTCTVQGQNVYYGRKLLVSNGVNVVTDRLGSVRANTQGEKFAYYPYGEERTTTPDGREKFGTYFRDGVGQDYAMARYYGSGTGRFWSADPYMATNSGNDPATPQSWNRYAYVQGDPANFADPTGENLVAAGAGCVVVAWEWSYCTVLYSFGVGLYGPGPTGGGADGSGGSGNVAVSPQNVAFSFAQSAEQLVKSGTLTDCQALAAFAGSIAPLFTSASNFVEAFGVLTPQVVDVPGVATNSNPVTLGVGPSSGFGTQYQDGFGTPAGPNGSDQAHHFAAFFQLGFYYGASSTLSWAWEELESLEGGGPLNQGDVNLGVAAMEMGADLALGRLNTSDIAAAIRSTLCAQ
jgi:RHS repeat-associated protein